ncbi:unnamed protein product [Didymodactylos carnosus]|uniref:AAA+ ATPase domain-containing protein n=1 Tax=Didymodactylos carnosus TaxID=1234261 RepID=A0A814ENK2_9BILA|nr:unnamed protein product [Didymodactylos carnosus]CAF0973762.1 unnamed protein product [Didymodactylos carnosus]CAF3628901.1 unnamed protein product [Didymodactylos carnosus]CAF3746673.1 unnamed protein product [Didymodactylos carnosus]
MSLSEDDDDGFPSYQPSLLTSSAPITTAAALETEPVVSLNDIILHVKIKYNYKELHNFINDLSAPNADMTLNGRILSVFELFTLCLLNEPVDMSKRTDRKIYRPMFNIQKNDSFITPFNFNVLLNLLEIEYENGTEDKFPKVWKTLSSTNVTVKKVELLESDTVATAADTTAVQPAAANDIGAVMLGDILELICRQKNYDEKEYVPIWLKNLKAESILTLDHLRNVPDENWDKLTKVNSVLKQLLRDYLQIDSNALNQQSTVPYEESKATLLADIYRVRRYFYYVIKKIDLLPYLSRDAVKLAVEEIGKTYDDDGNILINIQNYLSTFCSENRLEDRLSLQKQQREWTTSLTTLKKIKVDLEKEISRCEELLKTSQADVDLYKDRKENLPSKERGMNEKIKVLRTKATTRDTEWLTTHLKIEELKREYEDEKQKTTVEVEAREQIFKKHSENHLNLVTKATSIEEEIKNLENMLSLHLEEQYKKLRVKFSRGLLLYGPPGTGKSELLKKVAVFAGITMITPPLSAGELNKPLVGQTEKLLFDMMSRAHLIPYLICALTIDEIDGLVPKRDSKAQQSKVDGISVLLSHIEGIKDVQNLVVFGATNRRNMMDEAFLRRMQTKVFVGRPSPAIRKKMLSPLIVKNSKLFTSKRLDSLVKITTNFSGAGISALKSSVIAEMERNPLINDHRLLELADSTASDLNVWFGNSTLPEIYRLNSNLFNISDANDKFSLSLMKLLPTGRILIDLKQRRVFIELKNAPTIEKALEKNELSVLPRLIHGCSTRNIDTLQIIDLNFLMKQNAYEDNQIFELLSTTFDECDQYNRSMKVYDIDSLIMLNKSDSEIKSKSISNIRLYQIIRETCGKMMMEEQENREEVLNVKEKWNVIIVEDEYLKDLLISDIKFKKTSTQLKQEEDSEEKRRDDEKSRKCPKCLQNYIPSKTNYGNCHYHDGFVVDIDHPDSRLTDDQAQALMQRAKFGKVSEQDVPKLVWACCLRSHA